jgi:uncharacterized membrane protein
MRSIFGNALDTFNLYSGWIVWNLFLAFIPLAISFWLFRRGKIVRSPLWWILLLVYAAFLPNAPYLLTDVIHLIQAIRAGFSVWIIVLIFIPLHSFAILSGMEAYVISLINQSNYLKREGAAKFVTYAELITHALSAIGVYLGRFRRFNSWDFVTQPDVIFIHTVDDLTAKRPLIVMGITFVCITVCYWLMREITLGIVLRMRSVLLRKN